MSIYPYTPYYPSYTYPSYTYPTTPVSNYVTPAPQWSSDQLYLWSPLIIFCVTLACVVALIIIVLISILIYNLCAYGTCCCPTFGSYCCTGDCWTTFCCFCCPGAAGPVRKRKLILFNNDDNANNSVRVRRSSRVVTIEEPDECLSRAGSIRGSVRGSLRGSVRVKEVPVYVQNSRRPSFADMPTIHHTYSVRPAPAPVAPAPLRIVTQDIYRPGPSITSGGSNLRYVTQGNCAPSVMSGFGMVGNGGAGGGDLRVVVRNYPMQSSSSQIIHASCPPPGNQMSNDQYVMTSLGNQGQGGYCNNGYMGGGGGGGMYNSFSQDGEQHSAIIDVANNQSFYPSSSQARIVELNDDHHVSYPTLPQYYD